MRSTIVIIEDEPLVRLSACDLFQDAGIDVVDFANGDDAIDYLRDHKTEVAAVFTDIAVMVTSGQVSGRPADLNPLVRYIEKPWAPSDVLTTLQSVLRAA